VKKVWERRSHPTTPLAIILTECNRSRLVSLKFHFALILADTIVALRR